MKVGTLVYEPDIEETGIVLEITENIGAFWSGEPKPILVYWFREKVKTWASEDQVETLSEVK